VNDIVVIGPDDGFFWYSINIVSSFLNSLDNSKKFLFQGIILFFHW